MSHLSVAKFGGTSVANFDAMTSCANIVTSDANTRVVVLSASAGVTNYLVELANGCEKERREEILDAVRTIQYNIIEKLQNQSEVSAEIDELLQHIAALAESASLATSNALTDELICHGEMMSTKIFTQLLKERNFPAVWVDVRDIVATNSNYGKAAPNDEKTQQQSDAIIKPLIAAGNVVITQGFIGRDDEGKTTTLGRGGSDYSAALLAEVLNANDVLIWTDVPGIYTTDPRVVPNAQRIDTMAFNEAAEMATFGAKVLHPATLLPAVRSNIPVYVGSSKAPEQGGTWVTRDPQPRPTFRAIALRRNQTLLTLSSLSMLHAQGFLANVFAILAKHKISVDVITTSEVSVALTLDKTGSASSGADMLSKELLDELNAYCHVQVEHDLALIAIIGNNLHTQAGVAKQLFHTIENFNIRLISYGASTNNVCTLIKNDEADEVVRALHAGLFE
ncbi:lysine-sensitive aspartokinase 3 [Actinobacillus pleuropneumoniae]|uniref:Aspartokinase n=5 Tax=Actinobacillus pleuropneumoniae TaxID=715 RepID=A3N074_ACTP2|nr:lysine-sensitive aspartokinase 3 [Actinobacillus pleuropneumoniae]ABN73810.1 lysine-sensitive aspartokinase 3 [Actinobacillus pleuropneumoniae serovar 5b str. L20]ACE61404.1 lysine-sensitive aspartokinase 3 [Actinobacillus pleuropneumoniae serovar 7 str. AP76]ASU16679.1 Lysine-sensitive aspartokinase 3 [Actinobacillus pleuropneumoniae]AWG95119.1 lysine-sensitive aspartokinase 3 [Actinobacillus pleuropneumoniae serovar 1 str. 4074]AXA21190.1 lysine-sensitive aspartokinase 3 [Actinobacillus p